MRKGFTLIELLVVVLIIGILASVAVPEYQKTVYRAKAAEAWTITKAIMDSEERYRMANGFYTQDLENLDIEIPEMKNWDIGSPNVSFYSTGMSVSISLNPKFHIPGFVAHTYTLYTEEGGVTRTVSCQADTAPCMQLVPCIGIGSGAYGAHCTISGGLIGSGSGDIGTGGIGSNS